MSAATASPKPQEEEIFSTLPRTLFYKSDADPSRSPTLTVPAKDASRTVQ
jgi:hypothetical protein